MITSQQDKESVALSSLYDISDYTSYIDQRIEKLDLLYRRLSTNKPVKTNITSFKTRNTQQPKMRMYQTLQERFKSTKRETNQLFETSYNTEYLPKRSRYSDSLSPFHSLQLRSQKSQGKSFNIQNSVQFLKKRNTKNRQQKLKDIQKIKQEMLDNFYVGGNKISNSQIQPQLYLRQSEWKQSDIKFRKGRLWHGRPPVKIIQKFE